MLTQIVTVGSQVLILFILIGTGYLCGKAKILTEPAVEGLTSFMLTVVVPSALIDSFCRPFDPSLLRGFLIVIAAAVVSHLLGAALSRLIVRDGDPSTQRVLRFGATFGNCGYMGLPLLNALLGSIGVFYGAAYIMIFTVIAWTYGLVQMTGDKREISVKKIVTNPGLIGSVIGIVIFLFSVKLPDVVYQPIHYLAALNTPVPMVIVGFYLSQADLGAIWRKFGNYAATFVRLVATPLLMLGLMYLLGVRGEILVSVTASTAVPTAALTTMLSVRYRQDARASASIISMTTLLCLVTMPLIVGFAQYIGSR